MRSFILILGLFVVVFFTSYGCKESNNKKPSNATRIKDPEQQDSLFQQLLTISNNQLTESKQNDSLAFMIVPLRESCPSCLQKTIDSIVKYRDRIPGNRIVVISIKGGVKSASSYFAEQNSEMPLISDNFVVDTAHHALEYRMFTDNPVIYYTSEKKVYGKINVLPETVKKDLGKFFRIKNN